MKTWPMWIAGTVVLAAVFHILTVFALPYGIMNRAMGVLSAQAGGINKPFHPVQATAAARGIVRPSPDLLYTACVYDIGARPLRITSPVPDTYWSLSMFASNTDNFFVVNDRQTRSGTIEIVLATDDAAKGANGAPVVVAPTSRGIILFRSLIASEEARAEIDAMRRQSNCEPL